MTYVGIPSPYHARCCDRTHWSDIANCAPELSGFWGFCFCTGREIRVQYQLLTWMPIPGKVAKSPVMLIGGPPGWMTCCPGAKMLTVFPPGHTVLGGSALTMVMGGPACASTVHESPRAATNARLEQISPTRPRPRVRRCRRMPGGPFGTAADGDPVKGEVWVEPVMGNAPVLCVTARSRHSAGGQRIPRDGSEYNPVRAAQLNRHLRAETSGFDARSASRYDATADSQAVSMSGEVATERLSTRAVVINAGGRPQSRVDYRSDVPLWRDRA